MQSRGAILRVDLNTWRISQEPMSPELCRRFLGGEGVNSWLLWEHFLSVDPGIDPLSPDNVLIAGIGPLGATGCGGGTKMKWTFKSPVTNMFGDSTSGGGFPASLRWAGYDHLLITGKAKHPVYLWIDDDSVEVRDATHLWGRDSDETNDLLKEELSDEVEVACIGRAGENLVAYSSITVSRYRAAGRTGGGCIMGSKNLKAIVVRGTKGLYIHDPQGFMEATDALIEAGTSSWRMREGWKKYGTITATARYQRTGVNSFRNNQYSLIPEEKFEKLSHHWYNDNMGVGPLSCSPGCIAGCSGWYRLKGNESPAAGKRAGTIGFKPEYLAMASFGITNDIPDMPAVAHLFERCNQYGIDIVETGAICGLLMELWQRGIITEEDTAEWFGEPVRLEWGNYEAVEKIIDLVGLQSTKLGLLLKDGVYKAAQRIEELKNVPALKYALYGKGGSAFLEEVRHTVGWAVNMAVSSRGADHLKGIGSLDKVNRPDISMLYFGTPKAAEPLTTTLKGASSALAENRNALINSLGICVFLTSEDPILYPPEMFCKALQAATGMAMTPDELKAVGERVVNVEKAFNSRLGLRREDDKLCERWMKEPVQNGPGKGWKAEDYFEPAKDDYYEHHGWDRETSLPTSKKLRELGLDDVAAVLERENALV